MGALCKKCRGKAQVKLPRHNASFCQAHFKEYFLNQVKKAIKKEKMLSPEEKVLITVSGGKDSLVLWDVLLALGYEVDGLYIHLGIGEYSEHSEEKCIDFAASRNVALFTVSIPEITGGNSIKEASRKLRRKACAACGMIKRYLFNRVSWEKGYGVVATGHNLDDEAATLLGNLIGWKEDYLSRQFPVMPSNHPQMVRKIKPLYRVTEKETAIYAIMNGIDYIYEECPLAKGARSTVYKNALNYLEQHSPGTKHQLLYNFLQKGRGYFHQEHVELQACSSCSQPTTLETCAFCQIMDKIGAPGFTTLEGDVVKQKTGQPLTQG